jgi:hypothetical protein
MDGMNNEIKEGDNVIAWKGSTAHEGTVLSIYNGTVTIHCIDKTSTSYYSYYISVPEADVVWKENASSKKSGCECGGSLMKHPGHSTWCPEWRAGQ